MDYIVVVRDYVPVILSTVFVLTIVSLVPKSLRRIRSRATRELNEIRYHRCYAVDSLAVCCCKLPEQQVEEKPEEVDDEVKKVDLVQLINQLEVKTTTLAPPVKSVKRVDEDREQLQPVHVTQIAKIFENGDGETVKRNKVFRRRPNSEYSDNNHILAARQSVNRRPISEYFESTKLSKVDDVDDENVENHHVNGTTVKRKPISEYFQPKIVPKENGHHDEEVVEEEEIVVKRKNRSNGPVTSIEEILAQKRLSRPLSAYSISDLLGDSIPDDVYVENFFNNLVAK